MPYVIASIDASGTDKAKTSRLRPNHIDAVAYIENDPLFLNEIFTTYTIHCFRKFFDHKRVSG